MKGKITQNSESGEGKKREWDQMSNNEYIRGLGQRRKKKKKGDLYA